MSYRAEMAENKGRAAFVGQRVPGLGGGAFRESWLARHVQY